jgi:hypothetical protein
MNHFTPGELVDAADDSLDPGRRRHADDCASCARAVADLRAATEAVRETGDVPEPSPFFWDRLSARIDDVVATGPVPSSTTWRLPAWRPALAAVAAAAVLIAAAVIARPSAPGSPAAPGSDVASSTSVAADDLGRTSTPPGPAAPSSPSRPEDIPSSSLPDDFAAAAAVAGALDAESAHALASAPASGAALIEELTAPELQEFARLLRAEMGGIQ